ncbi:MAG: hypothetical protein MJZ61_06880 [Bacteroidales bacterium]|nr:hypothetical protein [Bacteroidales bacterium]
MSIEEACVYLIAGGGHGMTTDQLAFAINARRLHVRKDGKPVTSTQVYAVIMQHLDIFVKEDGRIRLMY